MSGHVRASLFQGPEISADVASNMSAIARAAESAAAAGSDILVTPEMSATGYDIGDLIAHRAEPAGGPIFQALSEIARANSIAVVYGYPERTAEGIYNSVRVIGSAGEVLADYRKTHLFGDLDRGHFQPGGALLVQFDFGGFRCGLLTCYDVEFPEAVRAHADAGTQWLIVPTGLMSPFEIVATHVVPARAYESQLFITYVNRTGRETDLHYCGLSCAVAPDGSELGRAGEHEQLLTVDLDADTLTRSRIVNTHLADRRTDLYRADLYRADLYRTDQETDT